MWKECKFVSKHLGTELDSYQLPRLALGGSFNLSEPLFPNKIVWEMKYKLSQEEAQRKQREHISANRGHPSQLTPYGMQTHGACEGRVGPSCSQETGPRARRI